MRKMGQLALAACFVLMPVAGLGQAGPPAASAPLAKAGKLVTVVGYDRSIRQEHFAGLSKPTVLRMQQQLEVI